MKTTLCLSTAAVAVVVAGTAFVLTGCGATATRRSTGEVVDDTSITTRVKTALVSDPVVKALDVKVDTFRGTVQLNGFVDSIEQKTRAEQIARGIPGVVGVQNALTVKTNVSR